MRRSRSIRELRQKHIRQRKEVQRIKIRNHSPENFNMNSRRGVVPPAKNISQRRILQRRPSERVINLPPLNISFKKFSEYSYIGPKITIIHAIDGLGLGGGQTMMCEMVNGLNKYYGDYCTNHVVTYAKKSNDLISSYGVYPDSISFTDLNSYCESHHANIVVQHRLSTSKCIRSYIPSNVKYVLINHTINRLNAMPMFQSCDAYISVCEYLNKKTRWSPNINPTRRIVILNGVENDYVSSLNISNLEGKFKTGRCHRMAGGKFNESSLKFLGKTIPDIVDGFHHHLIGDIAKEKRSRNQYGSLTYYGAIRDRNKKMSIIKGLDLYYYETFMDEGASIAVLESLGCGVPVICYPYGGNPELVFNDVNGFVIQDKKKFIDHVKSFVKDPDKLDTLKKRTIEDFNRRLHIKHCVCKYMQVFEALFK